MSDLEAGVSQGSTGDSPTPGSTLTAPAQAGEAPASQEKVVPGVAGEGSPPAGDGVQAGSAPASTGEQPVEGSIADSPPAVDPELEAKPGFQQLRTSYQQRVQEVRDLQTKLAELESAPDALLKIDAPVDDWPVETQLEEIKTSYPGYYNKMAWSIMETHLPDVLPVFLDNQQALPAELRPLVEASATAILQAYTGLEPEEIGEAISLYRSQTGAGLTPSSTFTAQGSIVPAQAGTSPLDMGQLATQFGLDVSNPSHLALLSQMANQQREMQQVRESLQKLTGAEQEKLAQTSTQRIGEQVKSFETKQLEKVTLPTGYEHVRQEIVDRVKMAFDSDPLVVAAKGELEKFYKQGTPDLKAAATKAATLQSRYAHHFKTISEPRLAEVAELERLKTQTSKQQGAVKNLPSGAGGATPAPQGQQGQKVTPDNIGDLVWQRYKASKLPNT